VSAKNVYVVRYGSIDAAHFPCAHIAMIRGPLAVTHSEPPLNAAVASRTGDIATMDIRLALESDFAAIWPIFQDVLKSGATYALGPDTSRQDAFLYWFAPGVVSYVGEENGRVFCMYRLVPNQPDLGSHIANASFVVSAEHSRKGAGQQLAAHCLRQAKRTGYLAIQFNFVVSTNEVAVRLWRKLGFSIVGTLPKVFHHSSLGYVDVYVMHRFLADIQA